MAFPFLTEKGGYDMIEEFEHYGKWSGGNDAHTDDRFKKKLTVLKQKNDLNKWTTGGGGYKVIQMDGYKVRQVGGYKVKCWFCVRPYNHPPL